MNRNRRLHARRHNIGIHEIEAEIRKLTIKDRSVLATMATWSGPLMAGVMQMNLPKEYSEIKPSGPRGITDIARMLKE